MAAMIRCIYNRKESSVTWALLLLSLIILRVSFLLLTACCWVIIFMSAVFLHLFQISFRPSSATCPNGASPMGQCVNGLCPANFQCFSGVCCPSTTTPVTTGCKLTAVEWNYRSFSSFLFATHSPVSQFNFSVVQLARMDLSQSDPV